MAHQFRSIDRRRLRHTAAYTQDLLLVRAQFERAEIIGGFGKLRVLILLLFLEIFLQIILRRNFVRVDGEYVAGMVVGYLELRHKNGLFAKKLKLLLKLVSVACFSSNGRGAGPSFSAVQARIRKEPFWGDKACSPSPVYARTFGKIGPAFRSCMAFIGPPHRQSHRRYLLRRSEQC